MTVVEPPIPGVILRAANGHVVSVAATEQEARALAAERGYKNEELTLEKAKMVKLSDALGVQTKSKTKRSNAIHQDKTVQSMPIS